MRRPSGDSEMAARIREGEERLRTVLEGVSEYFYVLDRGWRFAFASRSALVAWGKAEDEILGRPFLECFPAAKGSAPYEAHLSVMRTRVAERLETVSPVLDRWIEVDITPTRQGGLSVAFRDIEDRKQAEAALRHSVEHQRFLLHELQHRVRNTLAIVRSIASRTGETSDTVEDFAFHLGGRLNALARTQMVLTRAPGEGVDLELLVREELLAQVASEEQADVEGPPVRLPAKAAEVLALAVHELATNAVKYGALAEASGHVSVRWETSLRDGQAWLRWTWREAGVRVFAAAPRRKGFGTELIETRVPYELRGQGALTFGPGGVECVLEFPLLLGESILRTSAPSSGDGGQA